LAALARRDLAIEVSYQFRLAIFLSGAFVSAFLAFYVSKLVGDPESLERFQGSYFDYVVIGLALTSYAGLGVVAFTAQISREQAAGTLEVLLSGPTRLGTVLAGGLIVPLGLTTVQVALLVGMGVGVVGTGLSTRGVLLAVPVVVLTVVNFCALGIISAAIVLLVKRGDPISGPVAQVVLLLSGAIFPVELFPAWLEALCHVNPAYYGVRGLHEALLTDGGLAGLVDELAVLSAFACLGLPLSLWLFSAAVAKAKQLGVLGSY